MTSYMYNPSKKVTEILSKYLEFDPEQLQLGIWSGDLALANVNLRGDALYPKINRMKQSRHGKDPLKLKIVEGTIGHFRIQIPWKRLVWGQGEVVIDIKGVNVVLAFESREETAERRRTAKTNGDAKVNEESEDGLDQPIKKSRAFRAAKQKLLQEAEMRLLQGQYLATWLTHAIKKELSMDEAVAKDSDEKLVRGFEKWMKKASSNFVWRFLSGLKVNVENLRLVVMQDNIEIGVVLPNTHVVNDGVTKSQGRMAANEDEKDMKDDASFHGNALDGGFEGGEHIGKTIKAAGVSVFARRQAAHPSQQHHHEATDMALLPDDYILRPVDFSFSFSFFYPHADNGKRKALQNGPLGTSSDADTIGGSSQTSSKKRRGKREKLQLPKSLDGTAETELLSSLALEYGGTQGHGQMDLDRSAKVPRQQRRGTNGVARRAPSIPRASLLKRGTSGSRSAPLVRPDDLGSVYASAIAETCQMRRTAKFDAQVNCGEIRVLFSSNHLEIVRTFFAVGSRMRNGRPTSSIAEILVRGERGNNRQATTPSGFGSEYTPPPALERSRTSASGCTPIHRVSQGRRTSMGMRNDVVQKARSRRGQVVRSWWHYAYGVVLYEIQKRRKRRDNFRKKYVSFDWSRQKQKRKAYIDLYLSLQLDIDRHVTTEASVLDPTVEKLLRIEDELPIEQILLYRSIARALQMHRIDSMPSSLAVLYKDYTSDFDIEKRRASDLDVAANASARTGKKLSMPQYTLHGLADDGDGKNLLSMIGNRSDNARRYRSYLEQDNVQLFEEPAKRKRKQVTEKERGYYKRAARAASMGMGIVPDSGDREARSYAKQARLDELGDSKVSFAFDTSEDLPVPQESPPPYRKKADNADVKTVRTFRTTKSAKTKASAIAGTVVDNVYDESSVQAAKVSLSIYFKSVELMLVADDQNLPAARKPVAKVRQDESDSRSSDDVSELSFLSEEDFFREQDTAPIATYEEEVAEDPILSSTDFLLFGLPKNLLLHITLSPLRCSVLGRSGGSKNINFTIGSITASGEGRDNLLSIGGRASPTPIPVVSLSKRSSTGNVDPSLRYNAPQLSGPKEAVKFSLVVQGGHKVLQADVAKVHLSFDIPLVFKLSRFPVTGYVGSPKRILPVSAREEARLFILHENPQSAFAGINSSVRIHGIDLSVPVDPVQINVSESSSAESGSNEGAVECDGPSAFFSAKIIEMYSGTAVSDLCGTDGGEPVGALDMLDLNELVASHTTLTSHHCVVAVSGVDCTLKTETDAFAVSEAPSLLAEPLDIELLLTTNGNTILEEESPKQEIIIEITPIHVLLSETRLLFCSRIIGPLQANQPKKQMVAKYDGEDDDIVVPPRLEALSRVIMKCVDVSLKGFRLSLLSDEQKYPLTPGQKEVVMEESIGDFLSVASRFDRSYPNENALSSAMQIAIDRLVGLNFDPDDAWDCANSALLTFLEDDGHQKRENDSDSEVDDDSSSESKRVPLSHASNLVDVAISNAVSKALSEFLPPDDELDPGRQPQNNLLVVDFPSGAHISLLQLFYDFHMAASVPAVFVTNSAGVHLFRIVPVENMISDDLESKSDYCGLGEPGSSGFIFSRFVLDQEYSFGKGGLPLSVLGSDDASRDSRLRTREAMDDIHIGEFEFTFSHRTHADMIRTISSLKSMSRPNNSSDKDEKRPQGPDSRRMKSSFFAKSEVASVLLASDELVPFTRLRLDSMYMKKEGPPVESGSRYAPVFRIVSRSFALLNLTEEGQFYPDAISVLPSEDIAAFPLQIEFIKNSPPYQIGSKLTMQFRGFRIFLVRQLINELLQYLLNERYGVGKLKHEAKRAQEESEKEPDSTPPLAYKVFILDSSLVLPRQCSSHDMAVMEIEKGLIYNSRHAGSFSMPTEKEGFVPSREGPDENGSPPEMSVPKLMSRMNFQLHRMRLFTSLGEDFSTHEKEDSPIFQYFYDIDGRAGEGKRTYRRHSGLAEYPPSELEEDFRALSSRRWKEVTTDLLSLDVLVDYAPNLRVLITEPLDPKEFLIAPRLDMRLSQFYLLLSIWYCNMQELPIMFPYSASNVLNNGRNLLWRTVPAEYGTDDYLKVWDDWSCVKTEICVMLKNLGMRCTFDKSGYFDEQPEIQRHFENFEDDKNPPGVQIYFTDVIVHTFSDLRGMMRIGVGAAGFNLIDERRSKNCQRTFSVSKLSTETGSNRRMDTWADLTWGLHSDVRSIDTGLPQPFQLSVFMTKDWSLINLGLESPNAILFEFSPIWFFLGYFVSYYQHPAYGNPGHISQGRARIIKDVLGSAKKLDLKDPLGMNIDFRLWLSKPHLVIPCDLVDPYAPSLRLESSTGLWYRFKKIIEYKSQEVVSTGLDLLFANEFLAPRQGYDSRDTMVRHLVEALSFGLRLDSNESCNHSDYALQIPFDPNLKADCSITSQEIKVSPIILESPTICSPVESPSRFLGRHVCEITCIVEVLPLTSSVLVNLFKGPVETSLDDELVCSEEQEEKKSTFSFSGKIGDLRLFAVDPVLGVQLPVAVISISSVILTASQLSLGGTSNSEISRGESPPEDLQVIVDAHLWGDYFKLGVTRSWEPLLEPYKFVLLYELSKYRGKGISLNADCPLHVNVSGALLLIIDEVIDSFTRLIKESFGQDPEQDLDRVVPKSSLLRKRMLIEDEIRLRGDHKLTVLHDIPKPLLGDRVAFSLSNLTGQKLRIHQQEDLISIDEKQKPAIVTYLNHDESTSLSFDATISVIRNLSVVEVPYPGLPNSQSMKRAKTCTKHAVDVQIPGFRWVQGIKVDTFGRKFESLRPRSTDVLTKVNQDWRLENALQLLVEVGLDNGGRLVTVRSLFEVRNNTTHPLSLLLHPDPQYDTDKSVQPVKNTDSDGDSTVEVKSVRSAEDVISLVPPGEFYQIPTILLESSLHMGGSHLGSLWLRPQSHDNISIPSLIPGVGHEGSGESNFTTNFCSRPVQLAKIVHESALMFQNNDDEDISPDKAKSGIQISCPVKSENGDSLAPFCYAVEIGRSPIVTQRRKNLQASVGIDEPETHGPVAYTLSVHAPLVITNLLPETGRFELMHAVRRTVLWYGDLNPGQQMPVHSVGLDAPLLLLLNLGFCRTPVGEGALVHHGADTTSAAKDNINLKSLVGKSAGAVGKVVTKSTIGAGKLVAKGTIGTGKLVAKGTIGTGKVVAKGTMNLGKSVLTVISDSPDKRSTQQLQGSEDIRASSLDDPLQVQSRNAAAPETMGYDAGIGGMEDGKVHTVEGNMYLPQDVAGETAVVDSIGQRLNLNIENVRGGGGQRRIAVYCPFWIVNTTQHALRYKQENSKSFVSGTVIDAERDGSKPVDGSTRNYVNRHQLARATRLNPQRCLRSRRPINEGTIFGGTAGALATSLGRCDLPPAELTELIDKDLSLEKLSNLAFMFNFHDDVLSIGNRRLTVQLSEATEDFQYFSDWSRGFSLDSVGFSQIVALHCKEGRALELSVVVSVAPGFLSGYTKIVRFLPRYVLVNQLEFPVRLWQDSSVFRPLSEEKATTRIDELVKGTDTRKWRFRREHDQPPGVINQYEALWGRVTALEETDNDRMPEGTTAHRSASYITTAGPLEFVPFHLSDSRGERQLRVGLGGTWNLTASFASDFPGDHTLRVTRAVDLRFLKHVSTRASPQYKVVLPPTLQTNGEWDGELGIWFETDWGGDRRIIVKGMKRGRFCFNETDIHAGDELLRIDNIAVNRMSFSETMKLLKQRVAQVSASSNRQKANELSRGWSRMSALGGLGGLRRSSPGVPVEAEKGGGGVPDRLVLTFRTLEERLRRLRVKAARNSGMSNMGRPGTSAGGPDNASQQEESGLNRPLGGLRVEMKPLHHSMFVVLRRQDPENPPFRIENRSMNYTVLYRQRGCEGHPWNHLKPGQSQAYSWEEPMRPKRLAVRASRDSLVLTRTESEAQDDGSDRSFASRYSEGINREVEHKAARAAKLRQIFSYQYVEDEEQGRFGSASIVKLEEIGYRGVLSCPSSGQEVSETRTTGYLNVEVETDGATRILVVSDESYKDDEKNVMNRRLETLKRQMREEESRAANLAALRYLLSHPADSLDAGTLLQDAALANVQVYAPQLDGLGTEERSRAVEGLAMNITDDFPEDSSIHRRHQVVVEVLEAVGLNPENEIGECNPYAEVLMKGRSKLRKSLFQKRKDRGKTYYQKKSLAPKWTDQTFVFDVPEEAVTVTRGHSLHVRLRNFRYVGAHKLLGQAVVHLHSVRDQQELVGWYPLAGRTGSTELDNPLSNWGRGSVKLRIQWVHSTSALLDYFLLYTEKRLMQLQERKHGLKEQWRHATDSEKKRKERDPSKSAITQAVPKLQKEKGSSRKQAWQQSKESETRGGVVSKGLNLLIDPLKMAKDRTQLVSNFLRITSKKNREKGEETPHIEEVDAQHRFSQRQEQWTSNPSRPGLPRITEHEDSSHAVMSKEEPNSSDTSVFESSKDDGSGVGSNEDVRSNNGPRNFRSLDKLREKGKNRALRATGKSKRVSSGGPDRGNVRATGMLFAQKLLKKLSQSSQSSQSNLGKTSNDSGILENVPEEKRRISARFTNLDTIKELLGQGLLLHEVGKYYHKNDPYYFYGKADDGKALPVPRMKNWSAIQGVLNDETLDVRMVDSTFKIIVHDAMTHPQEPRHTGGSYAKRIAKEKLELPHTAPTGMTQRALQQVEYVVQSRNQFERACRRALRSVLNPGGWLTIRPVTALNLPDSYTGMHVKLRYGPEVVVSSTVDAKVTPTWTPKEVMHRVNSLSDADEEGLPGDEDGASPQIPAALNMDRFEFYENDLLFYVEPQKTSGSIRLSVVGERLNNKSELGVLHIPLGAAIGSCIDCIEDYLDSFSESSPSATPMYVRWFPLMNPKDTDPVEGDMGLSSRPPESEKLGDDMFQQYFAPCIQLALMWWPDDRDVVYDIGDETERQADGSVSFHPNQALPENDKALANNYFNADIGRISAALIDSERAKELVSFSALDIDVRYSVTKAKTRMGLVIGWVQLDHQEDKSREPVVLAPKPVEHIQPTCQLLVVKDNLRSKKNIVSYEHIRLTLEEMDLTIEEAWLFDLWDFFIGVVRRREVRKKANKSYEVGMKSNELLTTESLFGIFEPSDPDSPDLWGLLMGENSSEQASAGKVYVEQLVLGLLKVNLSYVKGKKQTWELTDKGDWVAKNADPGLQGLAQAQGDVGDPSEMFTKWSQHTYDEDLWAERQGKRSQNLKGIIGAVLPNVSDAPIRLQGKVLDNVFESPSEILSSISKFYVMETLRQVYKIIGSLDFVGNPTMLFSSFVSGVRDLVVTPSVAFLRSPTDVGLVGMGVAKGTLSLFSHSTSGIFGFIAKTTAAAGQAAAILSLDAEYREWHRDRVVIEATNLNREWKKRGAKSVSAMVTRPVSDLALGVFMGVTGLVTSPYKGFRDGGKIGFVKGVAIGGIGVISKPIVGLLDSFAHFTASVHDIAKSVNILERRYQPVLKLRLPYTFGLNNVLTPFDSVASRAVYLLKTFTPKNIRSKSYAISRKETHVASEVLHMEPGVDTYAIVTTFRVVLIKVKKDSGGRLGPTMCWEVSLSKEDKVSSQVSDHGHNGVALTITRRFKRQSGRRFRGDPRKKNATSANHGNEPSSNDREQLDKLLDDDALEVLDGDEIVLVEEEGGTGDVEDEAALGAGSTTRIQRGQWEVAEKEGAYHGHGATRDDAGDTLEWFTVLAEFPNRPQLTRIHNAIACILGDYDAVVKDQCLSRGSTTEGCTTFGLFNFEPNAVDEATHGHRERQLIAALERLPWLHEKTFEAVKDKLIEEQREIVRETREKWVFSRELEASIAMGGPAWLVEARAHAMFVPSEPPLIPMSLPRGDPVVKQILYQQDHGNISSEQVRQLFRHHMENLDLGPADSAPEKSSRKQGLSQSSKDGETTHSDNNAEYLNTVEEYESSFRELVKFDDYDSSLKIPRTVVRPGKDTRTQDLENFETSHEALPSEIARRHSAISAGSIDDDQDEGDDDDETASIGTMRTGTSDGGSTTANDRPSTSKSDSGGIDRALQEDRAALKAQRIRRNSASAAGKTTSRGSLSHISSNQQGTSDQRIDRMEALMEQLVVFNSELALMNKPLAEQPNQNTPESFSQAEASSLQKEISALRAQLAQQITKEEQSNEMLTDLRKELSAIHVLIGSQQHEQNSVEAPKGDDKKNRNRRWLKKLGRKRSRNKPTGSATNQHHSGLFSAPQNLSSPLNMEAEEVIDALAKEDGRPPNQLLQEILPSTST